MSNDQFQRADRMITWGLRGVIGLGLAACALVFQDVRASIVALSENFTQESREIRDRMMRLETQMDAQAESDRRRDQAIDDIRRELINNKQQSK